jgi:predicted kinase
MYLGRSLESRLMSEKLKLIVLSGLPGAGKSTEARRLAREFEALVVSRDDLRRNFLTIGEDDLTIRLVQFAASFLKNEVSVIVDSWNLHPVDRERWANLAKASHASLRWIHLATQVDECVRRDARRLVPNGETSIRIAAAQHSRQLAHLARQEPKC